MKYSYHINKESDPELILAWINKLTLYGKLKFVSCILDNVYVFENVDTEDYV